MAEEYEHRGVYVCAFVERRGEQAVGSNLDLRHLVGARWTESRHRFFATDC